MANGSTLQQIAAEPRQPGSGDTGGGEGLVDYRLRELERRVGNLETSIADIQKTVTAVQEQMKGVATKHMVSFYFLGAIAFNFIALLGHLLVRSMGS